MVQMGIDRRAQKKVNLYTNFKLNHVNYTMLYEPLEILDIETKNNVILGDEFYTWFDCYESSRNVLKAMRNIINVSRKKDISIIATTQSLDQLNHKFRTIIDQFIFPFYHKWYDILESTHKAYPVDYGIGSYSLETIYKSRLHPASQYFKYYDTNEIIDGFLDFDGTAFKRIRKDEE